MDLREYTKLKKELAITPNLCDLFKLLSIETWKRIEYAYLKPGIKVFETTITQNLIFEINALSDQFDLDIKIFEAVDENRNGNDLELIIRYPKEGTEFYTPIQAKKVYRNQTYGSIDHGNQIETLLNYALERRSTAFYLFYNYTDSYIDGWAPPCSLSLFGCSMVSANFIRDNYYNKKAKRNGTKGWIIPTVQKLIPQSFPWHELVCPASPIELSNALSNKLGFPKLIQPRNSKSLINLNSDFRNGFFEIGTYSDDNNNWQNIRNIPHEQYSTYRSVYSRTLDEDFSKSNDKEYPPFSPKSRIILTRNNDN